MVTSNNLLPGICLVGVGSSQLEYDRHNCLLLALGGRNPVFLRSFFIVSCHLYFGLSCGQRPSTCHVQVISHAGNCGWVCAEYMSMPA